MGCFDTYVIDCPHCQEQVYDQDKPGYMNTYYFGEDPMIDLKFRGEYSCEHCHKNFSVEMEAVPKMIVRKID